MPRAADEKALISQVVDFLNANGYTAWRQQNTGHFNREIAVTALMKVVDGCMSAARAGVAVRADRIRKALDEALGKSFQRVPDSVRGVADVIGWHNQTGRWIAVEVKIGADQLSEDQDKWLRGLKKAGGEVWLCRDFGVFVDAFWHRRRAVA